MLRISGAALRKGTPSLPNRLYKLRARGLALSSADESEAALLEMISGDHDAARSNNSGADREGMLMALDGPNGLATCSGLSSARLGDVVSIGGDSSGVVLSLERRAVRLGLLAPGARVGAAVEALGESVRGSAGQEEAVASAIEATLAAWTGRRVDAVGGTWPAPSTGSNEGSRSLPSANTCALLSSAVRHWRHWPSKLSARKPSGAKEASDEVNLSGIVPTGVPLVDALAPLRRGGALVLTGPPGCGGSALAATIARNHLNSYYPLGDGDAAASPSASSGVKRVLYVSLGPSEAAIAQTAAALGLGLDHDNANAPMTLLLAAPASAGSPLFSRTLAPFVALELAQAAASKGDEVLVVIDGVGALASLVADQKDAIVDHGSSSSSSSGGGRVQSPAAAASAARELVASLLDRACVLKGSGSISMVAVGYAPSAAAAAAAAAWGAPADGGGAGSAAADALASMADATLWLSPEDRRMELCAHGTRPLSVDWSAMEDVGGAPPAFAVTRSGSASNQEQAAASVVGSGASMSVLGVSLRRLLKERAEDEAGAALAQQVGIAVSEEDPGRAAWIQCARRARNILAAASGHQHFFEKNLSNVAPRSSVGSVGSDYAGGLAAVLCALSELAVSRDALAGEEHDAFSTSNGRRYERLQEAPMEARQKCAALAEVLRGDSQGALLQVHNAILAGRKAAAADPSTAASLARSLVEKYSPASSFLAK